MIEPDTVRLLRECNAGIKMGIRAIDGVTGNIKKDELKQLVQESRAHHAKLEQQTEQLLHAYGDEGKQPHPMAESMAQLKTELGMMMDHSDQKIADLLTTGCDMGVKSLSRYLNEYAAADEQSKDIAKQLIRIESGLTKDLRDYL